MEKNPMSSTAGVLIIGDEILSGRTEDANLSYLGRRLSELGIPLVEVRVVPDQEGLVVSALNSLRKAYTYVFTTGGIGGTHDDITAFCVAKAFSLPLVENPKVLEIIQTRYGDQTNAARRRMALMPASAILIENHISDIPSFQVENVFVLAGFPDIMRAMFENSVSRLKCGLPILHKTVSCRLPENEIAEQLGVVQDQFQDVRVGSYPFYKEGNYGVSIVFRGQDESRLAEAARQVMALIESHGGQPTLL